MITYHQGERITPDPSGQLWYFSNRRFRSYGGDSTRPPQLTSARPLLTNGWLVGGPRGRAPVTAPVWLFLASDGTLRYWTQEEHIPFNTLISTLRIFCHAYRPSCGAFIAVNRIENLVFKRMPLLARHGSGLSLLLSASLLWNAKWKFQMPHHSIYFDGKIHLHCLLLTVKPRPFIITGCRFVGCTQRTLKLLCCTSCIRSMVKLNSYLLLIVSRFCFWNITHFSICRYEDFCWR